MHLPRNNLLHGLQSGFRKKKTFNRNSVNSIIRPTAFWYWRQLCVWSCVDYSKAFDLINHKLLITKVRAYDIEIGLLDKMRTYLPIDLFGLYVLFSQNRSCDYTLEKCFFQISSYSRTYVRTHNSRKNKKSSSPGTSKTYKLKRSIRERELVLQCPN